MTWETDLYSRMVAWAKILLPLAALALLSTLFLISRTIDPTQQPPVTQVDLEQRARDQGVTNPSFAGTTSGGDEVMISARMARPDLQDPDRLSADDVVANIRLNQGTVVDITADHADMRQDDYTAAMDGNVTIETTTGYVILTDAINTRYDRLFAQTPGAVTASGPPGDLTAGRMRLTSNEDSQDAELLFTDGVKLIYTPHNSEE
ncbi:MAG: LPS export ABC transporter periplasmic protein LptC [Roseovarius sp.]